MSSVPWGFPREKAKKKKMKRRRRMTMTSDASRRAWTASPPFSPKSFLVVCASTTHLVPRREAWAAGQPWRRPACPSSVASRIASRTLYLASRRPRASAAPQPSADSQLTPTVSSKDQRIVFGLRCLSLWSVGSLRELEKPEVQVIRSIQGLREWKKWKLICV